MCFFVVAGFGLIVRAWALVDRQPIVWADSEDYIDVSHAPFWSLDFWAGERAVAVPLLLRLVGRDPNRFAHALAVVGAACWAALAVSVAASLPAGWRRWVGVVAVAGFSITSPVLMWERSVLSESLALSFLALLVAAVLWLSREMGLWQVAAVLGAVALWLTARDTHVIVVFVCAATLAACLLVVRDPPHLRELTVLGLGTLVLTMFAFAAAGHGQRHQFPLRNVYAVRILPYPDRVAWFADHGMPQAELFTDPGRPNARPPVRDPGKAPVTWVGEDDQAIQPWLRWVEQDGRATLLRWMGTHPEYVLFEPWEDPEHAFNNADGNREFYAPLDSREVPFVTGVFMFPRAFALLVVASGAAWAVGSRRWRSPLFLVGVGSVLLAAPHALVSWHSDGMETARHLLVPAVQFNVGALLVVLAALLTQPAAEGMDHAARDVRALDADGEADRGLDAGGKLVSGDEIRSISDESAGRD